jgi:hypothetical protein
MNPECPIDSIEKVETSLVVSLDPLDSIEGALRVGAGSLFIDPNSYRYKIGESVEHFDEERL